MRRAPADALRALAEMPIAGYHLACPHIPIASWQCCTDHQGRRKHQIPIALAAQPVPNFPRLRALALFGRLSAHRAQTLVIAGVQKPAQSKNLHNPKTCTIQKPAQSKNLHNS